MAVYDNKGNGVNWREQDLYGSSRLGIWQPNVSLNANNASTVWDTVGHKTYELSNHLGNVLATITDKRIAHSTDGTTVDYYDPEISTSQEYFAFGMLIQNRNFTLNGVYRYGFNGKENDNEVKLDFDGNNINGAQQDYGMRIYDPRLGRFLSVDPLMPKYPELTPYQFSSNSPIANIDEDGLEATPATANNTQLNAANEIVTKSYDPNHNRKDVSQKLMNAILQYARSDQGKAQMKTAGDLEDYVTLVNRLWKETAFSDMLGQKGNAFRRLINSGKTSAQKANTIRSRSASMESEMAKANLISEGLSDFWLGAMGSSLPGNLSPRAS